MKATWQKGLEMKRGKKPETINIEEFKALVRNLIPANLKQAEWICGEVERLTQEYPELKRKIEEWGAEQMPESEKRELEEIIRRILAEAEKAEK